MRRQHRTDLGCLEEPPQIGGADPGRARMRQRLGQDARARRPAGCGPRPHLADVVLVFGDVGEVGEIAEGAHDPQGLADRHAVKDQFQLAPGRLVVVAVEPDRGLPDALDQVEHVGALLVAHGITENPPEQADIGPQPGILLQRQRFLGTVEPDLDLGRHGLGRHYLGSHGWPPQKLPGNSECAIFLPQCKIKMETARIPITPSWPGLSRPSTSSCFEQRTWMPGTSPEHDGAGMSYSP